MWSSQNTKLKASENLLLNDLMQNLELNDESGSCSINKDELCDLNLSLEMEKIGDIENKYNPDLKVKEGECHSSSVSENSYVYLPNIKNDKKELSSKSNNQRIDNKQIPVDYFYNTASSQNLNRKMISTLSQATSSSNTASETKFKSELKPALNVNYPYSQIVQPRPTNYNLSSNIQNHSFPSNVQKFNNPQFIPVLRTPIYYSNQNIPYNPYYVSNYAPIRMNPPINTMSPLYSTNFTCQSPAIYNNYYNSFESINKFTSNQLLCATTDPRTCFQAQMKHSSKFHKSYNIESSFESLDGYEDETVSLKQVPYSNENEAQLEKFNDIADFISNCKDHQGFINSKRGSHYLKKLLPKAESDKIGLLLNTILPFCPSLMENCSGNYFCQELFRILNEGQRKLVWQTIRNKIGEFGVHEYANHCLQTLIELAEGIKEQNEIGLYLQPFYIDLAFNPQGSHIIQKILLKYTDSAKKELVTFIWENFRALAKNSHGVCVIKKYIMYLKDKSSKHKAEFIKFVDQFIPFLVNDTYAHYSLLCLLDEWKPKDYWQVLDYLRQHFLECSVQKYSSRIIDKLLGTANKVMFNLYIFYSAFNRGNAVKC